MNWFKERVGLQDPIYGPSAIQSVAEQATTVPYTELTKKDLRWHAMDATSVETQVFYVTADSGHAVMFQLIYSSVAGIRKTCQFSTKIYYPNNEQPFLWASDALEHWGFDADKTSFHADNCAITLSEDGSSFTIRSSTSRKAVVDLKFSKLAPGFVAGKDGTTNYGTDPQKPWGSMRHAFWPRCRVEGSIMTQGGELDMKGLGLFVHALQGMRPNLSAASWNFIDFQSPTYSAVMMEFTTPPSYGSTVVNVGAIAVDGKILMAGTQNTATHTIIKGDTEVGWPEPEAASFQWHGDDAEGNHVQADLSGQLGTRIDRVDILNEVPKFVKVIIAQAAGTRPYIYQYGPKLQLKVKIGEEEHVEEGTLFMESTFITGERYGTT